MKIYLAGGAVRDLILGRKSADKDFLAATVSGEELLRVFPKARPVGKSYDVFLIDKLEHTLMRGPSLEQDLEKRDITINACLLGPDGELVLHPRFLEDLKHRRIFPCSDRSFTDDPLRIFRVARFFAQLPEFTVDEKTLDLMRKAGGQGLADSLSPERVGKELEKALDAPRPGNFLRVLASCACLSPWFKEFEGADRIPAGPLPYHSESVFEHTVQVMDKLAGNGMAVWMGMVHDLGKTLTGEELWPRHIGHDRAGIQPAQDLCSRLALSNKLAAAARFACEKHMAMAQYPEMRPGKQVDLLLRMDRLNLVRETALLVQADHGEDIMERLRSDLETVTAVRLPEEKQNLGEKSGLLLKEMRILALKKHNQDLKRAG